MIIVGATVRENRIVTVDFPPKKSKLLNHGFKCHSSYWHRLITFGIGIIRVGRIVYIVLEILVISE